MTCKQLAQQLPYQIPLSKREEEVLNLIALGFTAKDIAALLFLSPHTIVSHKKSLIKKFRAKNIVHLAVLAERYKILAKNTL